MLFTRCILFLKAPTDGYRVSIMSRHTRNDGVTPDPRIDGQFDVHIPLLGPSPRLIGAYYRKEISWSDFERTFRLEIVNSTEKMSELYLLGLMATTMDVTLLCIEETAEHCHRRLVAEVCQKLFPSLVVHHRTA
jgi:uncharacterized protein YeaO (DUF488 family)